MSSPPAPPWHAYERPAPKAFSESFDRDFGKGHAFEIAFLEPVLEAIPEYVDVLRLLGHAYTHQGLHEKGLGIDLRLTGLCPDDEIAHYNLACSYALLGRADEAFLALGRAVGLGYRDADAMQGDEDLKSIRDDPRFAGILDAIRRGGARAARDA